MSELVTENTDESRAGEAIQIIVADDDESVRDLVCRLLEREGYRVHKATSGIGARQALLDHGADIIITDWMMPDLDGIELCRGIRSTDVFGFIYMIMLTAHSEKGRVVQALDAGADDFLSKPFDRQELLARVRVGARIVRLEKDLGRRNRDVQHFSARMQILNNELMRKSITDELTGLYNRRHAMERLGEMWALAQRSDQPLSCIMLDLDHFKQVNDQHGHAVGDAVLEQTAQLLAKTVRANDPVFRVGGEEFLILCPNSPVAGAEQVAERVRQRICEYTYDCEKVSLRMTASLGAAERDAGMIVFDEMLREADEALYQAKREGRNRVCTARAAAPTTQAP